MICSASMVPFQVVGTLIMLYVYIICCLFSVVLVSVPLEGWAAGESAKGLLSLPFLQRIVSLPRAHCVMKWSFSVRWPRPITISSSYGCFTLVAVAGPWRPMVVVTLCLAGNKACMSQAGNQGTETL